MLLHKSLGRVALLFAGLLLPIAPAIAAPPSVGPNVNMVSGTKWPEGDPFLTKQNEPSIAVSSRNPRHLLAGSNDYRLVPVEIAEELDDPEAWIQVYKSIDGGASWRATPLGGCPINIPECNDATGLTAPLRAKKPNFGADPTVRPGPYGTFFLSFIAGTRDTSSNGVVAVQRFVDKNNDIQRATDVRGCAAGTSGCMPLYAPDTCTGPGAGCTLVGYVKVKSAEDPILPDVLNIIDVGTPGQSKDKPWVVADVGRRSWNGSKTCELLSWTKGRTDVTPAAETVGAFNVYVSYANFTGNGNKPAIFVATSTDCGKTFGKPVKISNPLGANQGTSSAIDPLTGAVYVVWRNFDGPQAIYMAKSADGGQTWSKSPIRVATFNPYDQGATGVSFRTLDFPSVAVSVDRNGVSRVHVAWSQRKVAPAATAPYACPSGTAADCDARIVVATSTDGGKTFPAANVKAVDGSVASPSNPANPNGRGHQVQASLTFAAGKLLATWLDQRQDHTEGVLQCPSGQTCTNVSQLVEVRRAARNSNIDPNCHVDISQPPLSTLPPAQKNQLDHCNNPDAVWTTFITDGTQGLVRRHTLDAWTAMADPADAPTFASSRVSQYAFGNTAQTSQGSYEIVQKEVNPPNLPMFSNGKSAFMGDYIDSAGQMIVATGDPAQPYKFNAGVNTNGAFVTGGIAPAFHVAFTDNRDVIPPLSGDWTTPTCLTTTFIKDPVTGNITGVQTGATCGAGYAGNRNQNVYTTAIAENSVAFASANSKLLDATTPRGYVVTVRNLGDIGRWYALTLPAQPAGGKASFDVTALSGTPVTTASVFVQPRSASARTVWVKSSVANAKVTVQVASASGPPAYTPDGAFSSLVLLNPDANAALVSNGDGTGPLTDTAVDNVGNVVLSNAALTNNVLSNNALTNNALSNNALTNAALSNVVLSNAVLSNLDPVNAALSNNALTNNALSNVVLSNNALTNNALTNVVLSNVVLSNNSLNAALTNLDPANVALSNAVLSNNALTNVALTNNALSNVMLTNNALTNAVLSNVVLSNNALSNNALSNNALSNVALSNAPLGDGANRGDPEALSTIEVGAAEIAKNAFQTGDLANSNFKETTFTIRNRGNIDTTLAIKLMLRDAVCNAAHVCTPPVDASGNPLYKLQLVLRKVALLPVAIPPTGPAVSTGRAIRIGFTQSNTEVSNVADLPLIDPNDPTFGKFLPDDPNAAMLSLAAGEYAYATIRAIGVGSSTPPDPADILQWGVKPVATNATNANGPLVIRTLNLPSAFVALDTATPAFNAFGGKAPVAGSAVCTDSFGNAVLNGVGAPASGLGALGNSYIDTAAQTLYGPKTSAGWPAGTPLIGNGPNGPQASVPCPPGAIAMGTFTTDASFNSTTTLTFTPKYWGNFYVLANVNDASAPPQTDRQVIKVTVLARPPVLNDAAIPTTLTYNTGVNLRPLVSSDSKNGAGVAQAIVFGASGSCHMADSDNLAIDSATIPIAGPADCIVTVHQDGNEIYAPVTHTKPIYIDRASQTVAFSTLPVDNQLTFGNAPTTVVAAVSSPTAPPSGLPVSYASLTPSICTTGGTSGVVTIVGAGVCQLQADQSGNPNYKPAPTLTPPSFIIKRADQNIAFAKPADMYFGNGPATLTATSSSPTAAPSGIPILFASTTPLVCTVSGNAVTIASAGTCILTADQAGNANYNPALQATQSFVISKASQAITFGAPPSGVTFGDSPVTVSATSATVAPPSGATAPASGIAVTFTSQTPLVCTVVGSTVTIVAAGTCTIAADQAGNSNYNAAPQVLQSFVIARGKLLITATVSPSSIVYGDDVPPAPVAITTGSSYTGPAACLLSAYAATLTPVPTAPANAGSYTISASLTSTLSPSCDVLPYVDATLTVNKAQAQIVAPASYFTTFGTSTTIAGKLNRFGKTIVFPPDAVAITLLKGVTTVNSYAPTAGPPDGPFSIIATPPPEDYTLEFSYAGNTNFLAATPVVAGLRVEGFSLTANLVEARSNHTSTLLADGRVLVAGGYDASGFPKATSELYCPDTMAVSAQCPIPGAFRLVGPMPNTAARHTATLLPDGRVLVTGGGNPFAETFDPVTETWTSWGGFGTVRSDHTGTLLPNGKVLLAGGRDGGGTTLASTMLFDPLSNTFSPGAGMGTARERHTATRLGSGLILLAGGRTFSGPNYTALPSAQVYDPLADSFASAASMSGARFSHQAELLLDGRVVVAGGSSDTAAAPVTALTATEIYDPAFNTWTALSPANALQQARREFTMTWLTDGWLLAVGGVDAVATRRASSELFQPGLDVFAVGASMTSARSGHAVTRMADGRVLVSGGIGIGGVVIQSAEIYNGPP